MKVASRLAQQQAIGGILHEGMFEEIGCIGRRALAEKQSYSNEPVELHVQLRLWPASHSKQEFVREFATESSSDLGKFFGAAESRPRRRSRARLSSFLPRTAGSRPFVR